MSEFLSIGDFNNDGYDDIALGYSGESNSIELLLGNPNVGDASYQWLDDVSRVDLEMQESLSSLAAKYILFSGMAAAGDVDGDGADDLVLHQQSGVGWYDWNKGQGYIVYGMPEESMQARSPNVIANTTLIGNANDQIIGVGDVDGDRVDDLVIGLAAYRDEGRLGGIEIIVNELGEAELLLSLIHI